MSFVLRTPVAAACGMSCTRTNGAVWFALVDKLEHPVLPRWCVCSRGCGRDILYSD